MVNEDKTEYRGRGRPPKDGSKDHLKPAPKREAGVRPRGNPAWVKGTKGGVPVVEKK